MPTKKQLEERVKFLENQFDKLVQAHEIVWKYAGNKLAGNKIVRNKTRRVK